MKPLERRIAPLTGIEVREKEGDSDTLVFEGHAAVFNQETVIGDERGAFRERILPEAFDRSLKNGADVRYLINHEGMPLARTKSGTLTLERDEHGLRMHAELDAKNPLVQSLRSAVSRGDMDGMSFAFWTPKDGDIWDNEPEDGGLRLRSLREVSIHNGDVSSVTYPAYEGATGGIRADQPFAEIRSALAERGIELPQDSIEDGTTASEPASESKEDDHAGHHALGPFALRQSERKTRQRHRAA